MKRRGSLVEQEKPTSLIPTSITATIFKFNSQVPTFFRPFFFSFLFVVLFLLRFKIISPPPSSALPCFSLSFIYLALSFFLIYRSSIHCLFSFLHFTLFLCLCVFIFFFHFFSLLLLLLWFPLSLVAFQFSSTLKNIGYKVTSFCESDKKKKYTQQ